MLAKIRDKVWEVHVGTHQCRLVALPEQGGASDALGRLVRQKTEDDLGLFGYGISNRGINCEHMVTDVSSKDGAGCPGSSTSQ